MRDWSQPAPASWDLLPCCSLLHGWAADILQNCVGKKTRRWARSQRALLQDANSATSLRPEALAWMTNGEWHPLVDHIEGRQTGGHARSET